MNANEDDEDAASVPEPGTEKTGPGLDRKGTGTSDGSGNRLAHFIRMLSGDDEVSRWKAAEALGRMRDPAAVDELISTLRDDDARVRLKAAWALGRIGDHRAYAPLQRLYLMETEWAQEIIREALENIRLTMNQQ
jgi:HEAT repeat protein